MNQIGPDTELLSPTEAAFVAKAIQQVARNEASKAIAGQNGAHRAYAWPIYDPDMDTTVEPLVVYVYTIEVPCEPVDFTVQYGVDPVTMASHAPTGTGSFDVMRSTNGGASWSAITSSPTTVSAGNLRGVGASFSSTELDAGDMITMRMNAGGGGKGIVGQFRIRRLREHTRKPVRA